MPYYCNDCSFSGKAVGNDGACPACGSHNLSRPGSMSEKKPPSAIRLALLIGLWTYLLGHIAFKLWGPGSG